MRSRMLRYAENMWVVVKPATDVAGEWTAHCLDLDVMTQGTSPSHALKMACEAILMVIVGDMDADMDPHKRRAPPEYWSELSEIQRLGELREGNNGDLDRDASEVDAFAFQIHVEYTRKAQSDQPETQAKRLPVRWARSQSHDVYV